MFKWRAFIMYKKNRPTVVIVFTISLFQAVLGDFTVAPQNTLAQEGSRVVFNCTNNDTVFYYSPYYTLWQFQPITSSYASRVASCSDYYRPPSPGYSFQQSDVNTCNLILLNVTLDQAGLYTCNSGYTPSAVSQLIVIGSKFTCNRSITGNEYEHFVTMETGGTYYGSTSSPPNINWTDISSGRVQSILPTTANFTSYFHAQMTVSIQGSQIPAYNSTVWLSGPDFSKEFNDASTTPSSLYNSPATSTIFLATNIPSNYFKMCDFPAGILPGAPQDTQITQVNGLQCGAILTCSAVGTPPPRYVWTTPDGTQSNKSTVNVTHSGSVYVCTARNSQGVANLSYTTFNFNLCSTGSSSSPATIAAIILGILFAVSLIVIGVFIGLVVWAKPKHTKEESKMSHGNNNQSAIYELDAHTPTVFPPLPPRAEYEAVASPFPPRPQYEAVTSTLPYEPVTSRYQTPTPGEYQELHLSTSSTSSS